MADASKKERSKLVTDLKVQKDAKGKVLAAEKKVNDAKAKLASSKDADIEAMKQAVATAKSSDDKAAVSKAKDKAHAEYRKVLDQKINVATTERKVPAAKKVLTKKTEKVEVAIHETKKVAEKEALKLKEVADERLKVATGKLMEAQDKLKAAQTKSGGLGSEKNKMAGKANGAAADAKAGEGTLTAAQKSERAAKKAERDAKGIKLNVGPLVKKKLRAEAKKYALAGSVPQAPGGSPPPPPAPAVDHEKHRQKAKAEYHQAKATLASQKANKASQPAIDHATKEVAKAKANVDANGRRGASVGSVGAQLAAVTKQHSNARLGDNSHIGDKLAHIVGKHA